MYIPLTFVFILLLENTRDIVRLKRGAILNQTALKTTANEYVLLLTYQLINMIPSFLGNEYVYLLMQNADYMLRIELQDQSGDSAYAHYTTFNINDEKDGYRLTIGGYSGTAGNTL